LSVMPVGDYLGFGRHDKVLLIRDTRLRGHKLVNGNSRTIKFDVYLLILRRAVLRYISAISMAVCIIPNFEQKSTQKSFIGI
jgi:hypothetical protein